MLALFGATLRPGFDIVADAVRLRERLRGADLCITGEGRLDASSFGGKAAVGVARVCREMGVKCVGIVGSCAADVGEAERRLFDRIIELQSPGMSLDETIRNAAHLIEQRASLLIPIS